MTAYYFNKISFSDFGILPAITTRSNIAISGGFDLPKRTGDIFYDWPLEDSVEPFVEESDIQFEGRELTFSGYIELSDQTRLLPLLFDTSSELSDLSCKYGKWEVRLNKMVNIVQKGLQIATFTFNFYEPVPDLSGTLPTAGTKGEIDGYNWSTFSLYIESISGGYNIGKYKQLKVTQSSGYRIPERGGKEKTELEIKAVFRCRDFEDFDLKCRRLYTLFKKPGLRTIRYKGTIYRCLCADGFKITDIWIGQEVTAKFNCKLIIISKA